jgi:hypothetical protein
MSILTVSVILTRNLATVQLRYTVCSYVGKDVRFDSSSYINRQSLHRTDALCCLQLCSFMGKDAHFDGFSHVEQQSCHRTGGLCCV